MSDIVERLRQLADTLDRHPAYRTPAVRKAADRIEQLEGEINSVHAHLRHYWTLVDGLRAKIERLEKALIQISELKTEDMYYSDDDNTAAVIARAALTPDYPTPHNRPDSPP